MPFSLFFLPAYLTLDGQMNVGPGNGGREDFSICVQLCGSLQQQPQPKWKHAMFFQILNFQKQMSHVFDWYKKLSLVTIYTNLLSRKTGTFEQMYLFI